DQFDVILCLSAEEEPPATPDQVGKTLVVRIGHKGRYVGVVGAYRTAAPAKSFELHYQIVQMGEEYETDPDKEKDHKVLALLEDYAREVRKQGFVGRIAQTQHSVQAAFP